MDIANNPNGLASAVRTPEVRANADYADKQFTKLLSTMYKKGLSFNGIDAFIDSDGVKHYDNLGNKVAPSQERVTAAEVVATRDEHFPTPPPTTRPQFIAPPVQQAPPAITVQDIVHQFKIYDPVQQQILVTILLQ